MSGLSFTVKADEAPVLEDPDEMDRSNYLEYISVEDLGAKVTQHFDKRLNLVKNRKNLRTPEGGETNSQPYETRQKECFQNRQTGSWTSRR
jgi:hypothetical protein